MKQLNLLEEGQYSIFIIRTIIKPAIAETTVHLLKEVIKQKERRKRKVAGNGARKTS